MPGYVIHLSVANRYIEKHPEEIKGPLSRIRIEIENNYFTNERMSRNFPNLRVKNEKGEEVWIKTLLEN